ncbi:MFS transporter [Variovorax terrae]|uniref:MFS transporter n=1 Tax=Variovorax terrae TaxID=2923278 RepID=A0A9X1VZG7_9BURK|nr:MFS transporter [Variovorax terrae]MCJ0764912.1 MFS transporter [Variovorax terrae]
MTWNRRYEFKAVGLLALGLGLVGLDRFLINPLFPVMQKDLGLNYQDLGLISGVLALTWGLASVYAGRLADRIGRKKVLVVALTLFSLLVATTGLASGLISLLTIRALMGLAEGAYVPPSIVATVMAAKPARVGLMTGIQQMAMPLVGLGLGPVLAVALLKVVPSWHWVFAVAALPGLVLAVVMAKVLHDDATPAVAQQSAPPQSGRWPEVLHYRDVIVNTAAMVCYLTCMITLGAFMPNYLTDHLHLSLDQMSLVLAGMGGGSAGLLILPALSDRFGRKPVMVVALVIELIALGLLPGMGAEPGRLFAILLVAMFMNAGVVGITVGPLTSGAVPRHLATTATGIVVGVGEVLGGAMAPAVAGAMAHRLGIEVILAIALAACAAALALVALGVRELGAPQPHTKYSTEEGRS